jgi:hypothetical protein
LAVCKYHPARLGIGVCMRCRAVICAGCCTRIDGVNHCHACLRELGTPAQSPSKPRSSALAALVVLGLDWLVLIAALWLLQGKLAP